MITSWSRVQLKTKSIHVKANITSYGSQNHIQMTQTDQINIWLISVRVTQTPQIKRHECMHTQVHAHTHTHTHTQTYIHTHTYVCVCVACKQIDTADTTLPQCSYWVWRQHPAPPYLCIWFDEVSFDVVVSQVGVTFPSIAHLHLIITVQAIQCLFCYVHTSEM